MSQGLLQFKQELEKKDTGMTSLAGLPIYLDLASAMVTGDSIDRHLHIKQQGWPDRQSLLSLIMLNLSGGDCVEDLRKLEGDTGFCEILRRLERGEKKLGGRRWRKERSRTVPSASSIFRYLSSFHDEEEEAKRVDGKAFIPIPNKHLQGLSRVNADMAGFLQTHRIEKAAALDQDATLAETSKREALFSCKEFKAYQPLNTWRAEQGLVLHTEFRDGNVPAGYEQLRVFQESLSLLPESVEKVRLRSDTAGYQHELLRYCAQGENKRFGRIEFAAGSDVTPEFKKADLPGMSSQQSFPFPTLQVNSQSCKVFGLVTNMDWPGEALIHWRRERCGKSEEAHSVMKNDFAGGKLPSDDFGENAAWRRIMISAVNFNSIMKRVVLEKTWASRRMKAMRFSFINIPGRIVERSRELIIRLVKGHPVFDLFLEAGKRIMALVPAPG